ncbi:BON domain-containing protein [Thermodesulfobacteriota bacterium]
MNLRSNDILPDKMRFKNLFVALCLFTSNLPAMCSSQVLAGEMQENDSVIEQRISKELGEDPFIESHGIKVSVKDGTITLTGSVENIIEQAAAAADAFQGGAKEVHNLLKIENNDAEPAQKGGNDDSPEY